MHQIKIISEPNLKTAENMANDFFEQNHDEIEEIIDITLYENTGKRSLYKIVILYKKKS